MKTKHVVGLLLCVILGQSTAQAVYERAGWKARFSTLSHGVSGEVTIEDANTLRIDDFRYDGGGPAVYFYLGAAETQAALSEGLLIGSLLTGEVFQGETLVLDLPEGQTLEGFNAISVWCVDFRVNFGSGMFGSVVQYEVTFDATWSEDTHTHFPPNPHFSGLVGATHSESSDLWQLGQTASSGIEVMAETGGKSTLLSESRADINSGTAFSLISAGGIGVSPGGVSTTFTAHSSHPLVSLVSMIAPSPDWFVGVAELPLFEQGRWHHKRVVELYAFDAGTDSGLDFTSPNADTQPADSISLITGHPFSDDPPLGTFTFTLVCPSPPPGDLNGDCRVDFADLAILSASWLVDCSIMPNHPACQPDAKE